MSGTPIHETGIKSIADFQKKCFEDRFERLKMALEVKNDAALAKLLDIAQQTVSGAKQRKVIPMTWLEFAAQRGVSLDYVFFGDVPAHRQPIDGADTPAQPSQEVEADTKIAEQLVRMAIRETGFQPSSAGKEMLALFVKRKVVGDAKAEVIEILMDVMKTERKPE